MSAVGSLFCQGCGVDLLRLASALKALPVDERQQLLRQRVPHLEQWAGKWTRAICEPTEGHLWEADHIREVRHGGGEAGLANFQPLCVACHQLKTNRNSAAEARRRRQAAFQPAPHADATDLASLLGSLGEYGASWGLAHGARRLGLSLIHI